MDYYKTYVNNRFVEENSFISAKVDDADPPAFASGKHLLPVPFWGVSTMRGHGRAAKARAALVTILGAADREDGTLTNAAPENWRDRSGT